MPELPEVETIVRGIAPKLVGRRFANPQLLHADVLRGVTPRRLLAALRRNRIAGVFRRAKHVVIQLESGERMVIQPRMTGSLIVYDRRLKPDERRYAVLLAAIGEGRAFVYSDVRRLGTISLLDDAAWEAYTAAIGPEPLTDEFDTGSFSQRLLGTRQAIKKALMDQSRIAGIGNIYANEALFRARIDPSQRTDRLTPDDRRRLYRAVRHVLRQAVRAGGSTVRDYRDGTGRAGTYQRVLLVYGRGGLPCRRCRTRLSTTHAIDGRATTFCWRCQGSGS
ncbi:MAG: bifunctional DNA-formamidopyrimidine glycosylase/DNA-(apurinic or apyrimidinic site) lyase [Gemmatimonadetes bacterium]|nr:bifunctional DNA-formamidopyrimidine glycosylase/DNA-(apurinic or apyrimidinic site) lyase [Gemmatimonadota bacterium]